MLSHSLTTATQSLLALQDCFEGRRVRKTDVLAYMLRLRCENSQKRPFVDHVPTVYCFSLILYEGLLFQLVPSLLCVLVYSTLPSSLQEQREERAVLYEKEKEFEIKHAEAERERELYRQRVSRSVRAKSGVLA